MTVPTGPPRVSRRHLDALCRMNRYIPAPVEPEEIAALEEVGALPDGECHPDLVGAVAVLNAVSSKLHVRRWYRGGRSHLAGFVGPAGVTLLIGPLEADAPVRVVHRPRATTTPRLLAAFVGLGPTRATTAPLPHDAMSWSEVLAITGPERPAWVTEVAGPDVDPVVWDMAWQANPDVASSNVLNVIGLGGTVLAEVLALDRADPAAGFRLVARPPGAIWWALCRIVRGSGADPPPGPALGPLPDVDLPDVTPSGDLPDVTPSGDLPDVDLTDESTVTDPTGTAEASTPA
jgi:hypothetical protein